MNSKEKTRHEVELKREDAHVVASGDVYIYSWDDTLPRGAWGLWRTSGFELPVISGGIHIHGYNRVYLAE